MDQAPHSLLQVPYHAHSKLVSLSQGHQCHYLDSRIMNEFHKSPNPDVTNPSALAESLLQTSYAVTERMRRVAHKKRCSFSPAEGFSRLAATGSTEGSLLLVFHRQEVGYSHESPPHPIARRPQCPKSLYICFRSPGSNSCS